MANGEFVHKWRYNELADAARIDYNSTRKIKDLDDSIKIMFSWFNYMPPQIKDVIMEMCYQLGVTGFSKFRKTIAYLQDKQWHKASEEMLDSLWAKQTPNRAKALSDIVKGVE